MSQKDNFAGGFFLGAIVGGIVGGVLGSIVTSRTLSADTESPEEPRLPNQSETKPKRRSLKPTNGQSDIEASRRSLEDKIAQLNDAIDDVRHQLGGIGNASGIEGERSMREP